MRITWFGHAAFGMVGNNEEGERVSIILDPYNYPDCGGYLPIDERADVVSISHVNARYHSDTSAIHGTFTLLNGLDYAGETARAGGISFAAREVFEDESQNGPNAMVKFSMEGMTIAHQGDLGHSLIGPDLDFLRGCDVLLALAGGAPTIDLGDLRAAVDEIRPAVVIPMHFKTPKVNLNLLPVEAFLEAFEGLPVRRPGDSSCELDRESLPDSTTVLLLDHAR